MTSGRFALLGEPTGWHAAHLAAALSGRGGAVEIVPWRCLAASVEQAGESISPPALAAADLIVVRGMPGGGRPGDRLEEVIFRMNLLGRLAARGTPVFNNPRSLEIAIDKHLSLCQLAAAGIAVPKTCVAQDAATAIEALGRLGGDCVVKPLFGSRGRGLVRVTSAEGITALSQATAARDALGGVIYLQEFIRHEGWDVRILLVGEQAFCMRRLAAPGEWRTNVACGGRGEAFRPPADWLDLAHRAAVAVGTDIAGVDLLPTADGRVVVLEVNGVPGWRGLEAATGLDVTGAVADFLKKQVGPGKSPARTTRTVGKCETGPLPAF